MYTKINVIHGYHVQCKGKCYVVHVIKFVLFQGVQGGMYLLMELILKRYCIVE